MSAEATNACQEAIQDLQAHGAINLVDKSNHKMSEMVLSPVFCVDKKDSKQKRPILNLRYVNANIRQTKFKQ